MQQKDYKYSHYQFGIVVNPNGTENVVCIEITFICSDIRLLYNLTEINMRTAKAAI